MLEYLDTAIVNAFRQIVGGLGIVFILAFLMWLVSQKRRGMGSGVWGKSYYYFVAPGVMFHELGHAIGCIITLTKVTEFAPFKVQGETLGHVRYVQSGRLQALREFIIATGPVWLGSLALFLLGVCMKGIDFLPIYGDVFPNGTPTFFGYVWGVIQSAFGMFATLLANWHWTSPFYLLLLYLLFCITSEITLSPTDLAGMWRGFFVIAFFIIVLNLIPGVNHLALRLTDICRPVTFVIHTVFLFVLFVDISFFFVFKVLLSFVRKFKRKG